MSEVTHADIALKGRDLIGQLYDAASSETYRGKNYVALFSEDRESLLLRDDFDRLMSAVFEGSQLLLEDIYEAESEHWRVRWALSGGFRDLVPIDDFLAALDSANGADK